MLHEKSCGIIIYRCDKKKEYLLLKYGYGHWGFVKGKIEKGEKEKDTAVRESQEEAGITKDELSFVPNFKETISYVYNKAGKTVSKKVIFFLAKTQKEHIKLSYEHKDYAWLPYKEAKKKLSFKNSKNLLEKVHKKLTENISYK